MTGRIELGVRRFDGAPMNPGDWHYTRERDGERIELAKYCVTESGRVVLRLDKSAQDAIDRSTGFLRGRISVTRVGVLPYRNADGSTRLELRLPDEVFRPAHLDSIKMAVVTDDHPRDDRGRPVDVSSANASILQRGHLGSDVKRDDSAPYARVNTDITITDGALISTMIRNDSWGNSLGYKTDLEFTEGVWDGPYGPEQYHAIQRDNLVNHDAVNVDPRCGSSVRLHVDSSKPVYFFGTSWRDSADKPPAAAANKRPSTAMETTMIVHDGVTYVVSQNCATQLLTKLDGQKVEIANLKAKASEAEARADAAEKAAKASPPTSQSPAQPGTVSSGTPAPIFGAPAPAGVPTAPHADGTRNDAAEILGVLDDARTLGVVLAPERRSDAIALGANAARLQVLAASPIRGAAELARSLQGKSNDYVAASFDGFVRQARDSASHNDGLGGQPDPLFTAAVNGSFAGRHDGAGRGFDDWGEIESRVDGQGFYQ